MANLTRSPASRQIIAREPAQRAGSRLRGVVAVLLALVVLAGIAWHDGGEEPLHPIAQPVALPGAAR
jgi:hypothetical protein